LIKIIETKDGSHSLLNETLNETYHSTHGAIQESLHIFIQNGIAFFVNKNNGEDVTIFEVGFGTGLNALLALKFATENKIKINYHSIETFPIDATVVCQLNYPDLISFPDSKDWFQKIHSGAWGESAAINAFFSIKKTKQSIHEIKLPVETFEIIFFDAFAPAKQPDMWEFPVLEKVTQALKPSGVLVTYCAKGQLKRDLKSLGLEVETLPGPPGKREMVRGLKHSK